MCRSCWFRAVLLVVLLPGLLLAPGIALDGATAQENGNETNEMVENATDGDVSVSDDEVDAESAVDGNETNETVENATDGVPTDGGEREVENDEEGGTGIQDRVRGAAGEAGDYISGSRANPANLPSQLVNFVVEWVDDVAADAFEAFLEGSVEFAVGTPTMDNDGWMGVFGEPTNDHYESLYDTIYLGAVSPIVLFVMVLSIMVVATILPFGSFFNSYQASSWVLMIMGGMIAFALAWPITSFMHLAADSIATWFSPSPDEITGNLPQLTGGGLAAAGGIYLFGWFKAAIFGLLWGLRHTLLIMVMPYLFPFALAFALLGPHKIVRRSGSLFIWSYIALLIMPIPAGLLFSGALAIDWGLSTEGMAGVFLTLGTLFLAILLPLAIMKGTFVTSALMAGSAGAISQGVRRRSEIGYGVKTPQQARHTGSRARDIVSGGAAAGRSRAMNIGERIGLISNERKPSLDPRVHNRGRGRGTGSTQAERTTMVRQASRDRGQPSSRRSVGSIGGRRDDVDAYRQVSD